MWGVTRQHKQKEDLRSRLVEASVETEGKEREWDIGLVLTEATVYLQYRSRADLITETHLEPY